jgi:fructose-specific phosphotransferase system IIC component
MIPFGFVASAVTSAIGIALGYRAGIARLGAAVVFAVETVGAVVLILVANLAIGATLVLVLRRLDVYYTTLYEIADVSLVILSLLQALLFQAWRRR